MTILDNNKHFLHKHLSFLESTGIHGKDGGYIKFLADKGVSAIGEYWNTDHSTIDWNKIDNHFQFFFDFEGNEQEIKNWLKQSDLKNYEYLFTWLSWDDPIIKIKTKDFIDNWEEFNIASGWEGLILTTGDGKLFLEFTDDWKHHLNSNFEISPNTKASR
jgi:hypothetical protein